MNSTFAVSEMIRKSGNARLSRRAEWVQRFQAKYNWYEADLQRLVSYAQMRYEGGEVSSARIAK